MKRVGELFFETGEGGFVAVLAMVEPESDAGHGGGGYANLFGDIEVGDFFVEKQYDLPPLTNSLEFLKCHKITEKSR